MEILKRCSLVTCPMRAATCKYALDFNPKYDKLRTQWERRRAPALALPRSDRRDAVVKVDKEFLDILEPLMSVDVKEGIVKCKADLDVPLNENLSLDQIAETFGLTRPRVQQIESRAKKKILQERTELMEYMVRSNEAQ